MPATRDRPPTTAAGVPAPASPSPVAVAAATTGPLAGVFRHLAADRGLLFCVCLAANAIFLPYGGISRDAKQYAAQVIQAADGRFGNDLFFKYGDQSTGTVLPRLLAWPAARFGVEPVFFVIYLLTNAARLWAAQRLVLRVLGPSPGVAAGLLLAAVAPVPIGWGTFAVNESVLTARAPAVAAALFGLDCLLAGRRHSAAGWLAVGLALHPLMAAPAAAVAICWAVLGWATGPRRWAVVGLGLAVVAAGVIGYLVRTAGTLDPVWRELVLVNNPHVDPARWDALTWARLVAAIGCATAVARARPDPAGCRLLNLIVVGAVAGLVVAAVAARGPWALVFQGQAARAVWPLELFWFPLGLVTIGRLWEAGPGPRAGAVALFILLAAGPNLAHPAAARVLTAATVVGLVSARVQGRPDWVWRGLAVGVGLWGVVWYLGFAPGQLAAEYQSGWFFAPALADRVHVFHDEFGPLPRLTICLAVLAGLGPASRTRLWKAVAIGVWAAASGAAYLLPQTDWAGRQTAPRPEDVQFAREVIGRSRSGTGRPTIYWPGGRMDTIWFDLDANSYFTYWQLSANIFFRGAAIEGARRWDLAGPFEADPDRPPSGSVTPVPPTIDQLRVLAADPAVDFVILPYDFGGAVGTNGAIRVYDCRKIRAVGPDTSVRELTR